MKKQDPRQKAIVGIIIVVAIFVAYSLGSKKGNKEGGFNVTLPAGFIFAEGAIWEDVRFQTYQSSPHEGILYNTPDFLIVDQPLYERSLMEYVMQRHDPNDEFSEVKVGRRKFIRVMTSDNKLGYYTEKKGWVAGIVDPLVNNLANEEAILKQIVSTLSGR